MKYKICNSDSVVGKLETKYFDMLKECFDIEKDSDGFSYIEILDIKDIDIIIKIVKCSIKYDIGYIEILDKE